MEDDGYCRWTACLVGGKIALPSLSRVVRRFVLGEAALRTAGGKSRHNDAAYPEMPRSAADIVALDYCIPLAEMPGLLLELVDRKDGKISAISRSRRAYVGGLSPACMGP